MLSDTRARKRLALELLARGYTKRRICSELSIKGHKLHAWKQADTMFRDKWNEIMDQLGRWIERDRGV